MTSSVTAPLERQFGQIPGLKQMSSTSSGGASVITLQFNLDLSLDVAEQGVQAAINAASNLIPQDLPAPPIYSKVNPADAPILTLGLTSKTLPLPEMQNLADTRLAQKISQLPGVGLVTLSGGQRPAVRVQANPKALAANGLGLVDVRTAIAAANVNKAKGSFDGAQRSYTIDANDQLRSAVEYKGIVVAYRNGAPIYLSDVADVIEDAENVRLAAWMNDVPAVILNIQRQPGANVIEVVDRVQASAAATAGVAACGDRRRGAHRPHRDDPGLGARRAARAAAGDRVGRDGDLPLPAQRRGHPHSQHRRAVVARWYFRLHVPCRFLHQQPHADGAGRRYRLRGRRRDRGDREHRPLRRARAIRRSRLR